MTVPLEVSAWKPAPFALGGETVFAVGDVHGCAVELKVLLDGIAGLAKEQAGKRRLIYLGDMINRGPDSIGVLELWAEGEKARGVDHIDRVMGNHEIMMMLTVVGGPHAHKAETMWLSKRMGGQKLLDQMAARVGCPAAHADFLDWKQGFGGTLVVHGHTPPDKHKAISGMDDPHLFEGDRLGLDGGSARTGIVTAAEIQDGRYRILKAGTPFENPEPSGA